MALTVMIVVFAYLTMSQTSASYQEVSKYQYNVVSELTDRLGTVGVLFDSPARSFLHCSALCAQTCCQRFTYSLETGTRRCRGYSRHSSTTTLASAGARTYAWNVDMPGKASNVALKKPATMSSVYTGSIPVNASLAVDGNTNPSFMSGSCAHTNVEAAGSWWQVDLQGEYVVYSVLITNRGDCCVTTLHDFNVQIYSTNSMVANTTNAIMCHRYDGPMGIGVTEELPCCRPITGRFVRINNAPNSNLILCEVKVMTIPSVV